MRHDLRPSLSGGAPGAEAAFGACAERHGVEEVNFTFEGHRMARQRGVRMLNHEELQAGDVSLAYVSRLMHRRYTDAPTIRRVLQSLWYQVNQGQEIYVIGTILDDLTVRGGTGWGAEFAKLCNKPLYVFDQAKNGWFEWTGEAWESRRDAHIPSLSRIPTSRGRARARSNLEHRARRGDVDAGRLCADSRLFPTSLGAVRLGLESSSSQRRYKTSSSARTASVRSRTPLMADGDSL